MSVLRSATSTTSAEFRENRARMAALVTDFAVKAERNFYVRRPYRCSHEPLVKAEARANFGPKTWRAAALSSFRL